MEVTSLWWSYCWAVSVTAAVMGIHTLVAGRASAESLRGLTLASCKRGETLLARHSGWQERTRAAMAALTQKRKVTRRRWDPQWTTALLIALAGIVYARTFN